MTNTKFRKRALLSSVAMLLVALVALGSATFAWFTSSTTATADGIKVSTIKSSELQISKSNLAWGTQVDYAKTGVFAPASSANGTTWYSANAANKNSYAKSDDDDFDVIPAANYDGYLFTEALNIRNNGSADVEHVTITISGLDCNYARLAIYEVTANNGTTAKNSSKGFAQCIYDNAGTQYAAASGAKTTTNITPTNVGSTATIDVGTLAGKADGAETGETVYYKLYVWFEGQDQQCTDANAGASFSTLTNGLTFQVTGSTKTSD